MGRRPSHGHTVGGRMSPTYQTWNGMKTRCDSGEYGVGYCQRWSVFENFLADMGERPAGKTLDRIDNAHGYEPKNCRWANRNLQARNRSTTKLTLESVREIRRRAATGAVQADLAYEYGVSRSRISTIVNGKAWVED